MSDQTYTIDEITLPASMDDDRSGDYAEMIAVGNEIEIGVMGTDALTMSAGELLPIYSNQEYNPRRRFVVRVDGRIVGRAHSGGRPRMTHGRRRSTARPWPASGTVAWGRRCSTISKVSRTELATATSSSTRPTPAPPAATASPRQPGSVISRPMTRVSDSCWLEGMDWSRSAG